MEVDPDLRYKTAAEVLQDIEREQVDSSLLLKTRKAILRRRGWIAAVLLGSLGLAVWVLVKSPSGEVQADVPVTTIAILPFHNMTGNAELAWMENGLPEMLITDISQSRSLRPVLAERIHGILRELAKEGQSRFDEQSVQVICEMSRRTTRSLDSSSNPRVDCALTLHSKAPGTDSTPRSRSMARARHFFARRRNHDKGVSCSGDGSLHATPIDPLQRSRRRPSRRSVPITRACKSCKRL